MVSNIVWALLAVVIVVSGFGIYAGTASLLAITSPAIAVEYDGSVDADWITIPDNEFYSDSSSKADFVETDADDTITGNMTLENFTSSGQDKQFAMKVEISGGPIDDVEIKFDAKTDFAKTNLTIKSLDIKRYDADDTNLREYSLTVSDDEVDADIGALAKGDYVIVGIIRSLGSLGNQSSATIYDGKFDCDNDDAEDVHEIDFDILGASLVA